MAISLVSQLHTAYRCKAIEEPEDIEEDMEIPRNTDLVIFSHGNFTKIRWKNKTGFVKIIVEEDPYSLLKKLKPFTK